MHCVMSSKTESKTSCLQPSPPRQLRQVNCLLSGIQPWSRRVLASNGTTLFAYSSTTSVYIYNLHTCTIQKLISAHTETITGITWAATFPNLLITCSVDGCVCVWDVTTEKRVYRISNSTSQICCVDCAHGSPLRVAYGAGNKVYEWIPSEGKKQQITKGSGGGSTRVSVVTWNPTLRRGDCVAMGREDGRVEVAIRDVTKGQWQSICLRGDKDNKTHSFKHFGQVLDIRWDPLSHIYLLVLWQSGKVAVFDTENIGRSTGSNSSYSGDSTLINLFTKCGASTRGISWMPWQPGNFMTVGNRTGIISVWNVSGTDMPLETSKPSNIPFCYLQRVIDRVHSNTISSTATKLTATPPLAKIDRSALCSFIDGSVGLLDLERQKVVWKSFAGHRETIFDVQFHPINDRILATGSYDGTVRIWNIDDMSLIGTCRVNGNTKGTAPVVRKPWARHYGSAPPSIVYSVSWQQNGNSLAIGISDGSVQIWDIIIPATHDNNDWNDWNVDNRNKNRNRNRNGSNDDNGGGGKTNASTDENVRQQKRFRPKLNLRTSTQIHREQIFCVDWSPITLDDPTSEEREGIIASASKDCKLIISTALGTVLCSYHHPGTVYGCAWNSNFPNILSSTCEDGGVRIFQCVRAKAEVLNLTLIKTLRGHKSTSFKSVWNPHHPDILASGSNDTTIRVWDVSNKNQNQNQNSSMIENDTIAVLEGHTHNIRALLWSYEFPEILISGSWDTTIRIWNVQQNNGKGGKGMCLQIIRDHHSDVYGMASHPNRPFTLVSSSRDTTLRVWRIDSPSVVQCRIHSLLGLPWDQIVDNEKGSGMGGRERARGIGGSIEKNSTNGLQFHKLLSMCGRKSYELQQKLNTFRDTKTKEGRPFGRNGTTNENENQSHFIEIKMMFRICDFYGSSIGLFDLYQAIISLLKSKSIFMNDQDEDRNNNVDHEEMSFDASPVGDVTCRPLFRHISNIDTCAKKKVASLINKRGGSAHHFNPQRHPSLSVQNRIDSAVDLLCKLQDVRSACELLVLDGDKDSRVDPHVPEWDRACALAPGVSMEYWQELTTRRILWLKNEDGSVRNVVGGSSVSVEIPLDNEKVLNRILASMGDVSTMIELAKKRGEVYNTLLLSQPAKESAEEIEKVASRYFQNGQPLFAAAAYLSVSDIKNAVSVLIHGHELELALVVSLSLSPIFNDSEHFLRIISEKIVKYRLEPIASAINVSLIPYQLSQQIYETYGGGPTTSTTTLLHEACGRAYQGRDDAKEYKAMLYETMTMRRGFEYLQQANGMAERRKDNKRERQEKQNRKNRENRTNREEKNQNTENETEDIDEEKDNEDDNKLITIMRYYLLGNDSARCGTLGVNRLYEILSARHTRRQKLPVVDFEQENRMMRVMSSIDVVNLTDETLKSQILLLSIYYGAQKAMLQQRTFLVKHFFELMRTLKRQMAENPTKKSKIWPIPLEISLLEEAKYMLRNKCLEDAARVVVEYQNWIKRSNSDDSRTNTENDPIVKGMKDIERSLKRVGVVVDTSSASTQEVGGKETMPGEMMVHTSSLEDFVETEGKMGDSVFNDDDITTPNQSETKHAQIICSGQLLPSGHHARQGITQKISCVTGEPISGSLILLEDGISCMTFSEAVMYNECSLFSPLLTGNKLPVL